MLQALKAQGRADGRRDAGLEIKVAFQREGHRFSYLWRGKAMGKPREGKMSDLAIISSFCISLFGAMMIITAVFEGNLVEIEFEEDEE